MPVRADRRITEGHCPSSGVVRRAFSEYVIESGLSPAALAVQIGYSRQTLDFFLRGDYRQVASTDRYAARKIWQFIQRHPVEPGRIAALHSGPRFDTTDGKQIEQVCTHALESGGCTLIQSGPGTQKSYSLYRFFCDRNRKGARDAAMVYAACDMTPSALLRQIAETLGVYSRGNRDQLMRGILWAISTRSHRPVILVDEADHLVPPYSARFAAVETLREIYDRSGCGIVLTSNWEFDHALRDGAGRHLQRWHRRLSRVSLTGLMPDEIDRIVRQELGERFNPRGLPALLAKCKETRYGRPYYSCGRLVEILRELKSVAKEKEV